MKNRDDHNKKKKSGLLTDRIRQVRRESKVREREREDQKLERESERVEQTCCKKSCFLSSLPCVCQKRSVSLPTCKRCQQKERECKEKERMQKMQRKRGAKEGE